LHVANRRLSVQQATGEIQRGWEARLSADVTASAWRLLPPSAKPSGYALMRSCPWARTARVLGAIRSRCALPFPSLLRRIFPRPFPFSGHAGTSSALLRAMHHRGGVLLSTAEHCWVLPSLLRAAPIRSLLHVALVAQEEQNRANSDGVFFAFSELSAP
jgi:hypothetical protein